MGSSRNVTIGGMQFGGGAPIRVESMLKSRLEDPKACIEELEGLAEAGCELVRVAFPQLELFEHLVEVCTYSPIPIMGDIHFNYALALKALDAGVSSIRINPGNMADRSGLLSLLQECKARNTVIRVGANGGSVSNDQIQAAKGDKSLALVYAVEEQLQILEAHDFKNLIISAKSSSVTQTIRANSLLAEKYPYPLHIGITEAGPGMDGAVKSSVGIGILLSQGIGDTLRVSLSSPAVDEVRVGYGILKALELRQRGINLISCPGCGRRRVDVQQLVEEVVPLLPKDLPDGFTVAVMGCEVNGPKEAAGADFGIAGTAGGAVFFKRGKVVAQADISELKEVLKRELGE